MWHIDWKFDSYYQFLDLVCMKLRSHWAKYVGGVICTLGGIYIGNGYGAAYWRFGPFNLAWDTAFRGIVLVLIGLVLIRLSK